MHCGPGMTEALALDTLQPDRQVWIVEDEPAAGDLASELCEGIGAESSVFRAPLPFLAAMGGSDPPTAIVLDWRLERELSAALFLATRHRYPQIPVIYWTCSPTVALPAMILDDPCTKVVEKTSGTASLEEALNWALAQPA